MTMIITTRHTQKKHHKPTQTHLLDEIFETVQPQRSVRDAFVLTDEHWRPPVMATDKGNWRQLNHATSQDNPKEGKQNSTKIHASLSFITVFTILRSYSISILSIAELEVSPKQCQIVHQH